MPAAPRPAPATPVPPQTAHVLRQFRLVFNAIKSHFRAVEKLAGVSGAQLWALSVVSESPGIGVGGLAAAMDVHQSTASNLLRSLIETELVVRERGAQDRRAVQLRVTARGRRILARAPGPLSGVLPDALARLDRASLARLERDLASLIAQLPGHVRESRVPLGVKEPASRRRT